MIVTESEAELLTTILRHLRAHEYSNLEISRRGDLTYINIGHSIKLKIHYIGSVANGTERAVSIEIVE